MIQRKYDNSKKIQSVDGGGRENTVSGRMRELVRSASSEILPKEDGDAEDVPSMPGVKRHPISGLLDECRAAYGA